MGKNIVLIGMPGVGKSTSGVILAKVLNYDFLDSDLVIQHQTGKLLKEIIAEKGIDGFNAVENEINSQIDVENTVIATGGSVIFGADAMAHFKESGIVVYLRISYDLLDERLGDLDERGVVHKEGRPCGIFIMSARHFMKNTRILPWIWTARMWLARWMQ